MTKITNSYENWRPIDGWQCLYEASDMGRIRSIERQRASHGGTRWRTHGGRILNGCVDKRGYVVVTLRDSSTRRQCVRKAHNLVLRAFRGEPPIGMVGRHLDDDKLNNKLSNLSWGTCASNSADMVRNGGALKGERNHNSKLTERQVRAILGSPLRHVDVARKFNVSATLIGRIRRGQSWAHMRTTA